MRRALLGIALAMAVACNRSEPRTSQSPPPPSVPQASSSPSGVPPIPFDGAARPPEIVRAVYTFAADHPEILSKVPCFCGCQRMGHRDNDDCFVSGRDQAGKVTQWEPHGAT